MPHVPDFPSTDEDETDDRSRGGLIDRIIDGGFPSPDPG